MGIVQFCTLLLHRLVGVAVDKPQAKCGHVDKVHLQAR